MTKPKPKALGSTIDVPEGATVTRPGGVPFDSITVTGGVYVFDVPGTHTIDGTDYEVDVRADESAQA
jgi:hypothetical protein